MREHLDSWSVDTDQIRKRLEDRGPSAEDTLALCGALEELRTWNTSLSDKLMREIEALNKELVVQRRANSNLLSRVGQAEAALSAAEAGRQALAEITADLVAQRDEAQAMSESPYLP